MDGEKAFHFSYLKAHMLIRKEKQQLASLFSEVIGQEDIFSLVRLPLVENCLLGFNSSIFAYGQIGSGKTYIMWGPLSALSENSTSSERGLTPRVFEQLFSRIKEEKVKHADKELTYNCVCSFLEK